MADKLSDIGTATKEATETTIPSLPTGIDSDAKGKEIVDDVPDPDEDDLDDLDDFLDDFSTVKLDPKQSTEATVPSETNVPLKTESTDPEDAFSEEEFAKQLQAGMADLLGDVENNSELQAQFESIFKELGAAAATSGPSTAAPGDAPKGGASFQDNIRRALERMQASGESATAAATADSESDENIMAELLKQMQAGGGVGEGGEGADEEFSKMLLGMMEQLTNKEILYEPMKELNEKFPTWLEQNRAKTLADELTRYEEQKRLVGEIVAKFEETTYSDSNAADREYIVDRMQKMQAAGSPPADLVGDMPSTQETLGVPDEEACAPQ